MSIQHFLSFWGGFLRKFIKNSTLLFFLTLLIFLILCYPKAALSYALRGLNTWFERMIPTLFPFMVLTGIMIRMQLTEGFARFFRPVLFPLLHLPDRCLYTVTLGFLCGFPMGAKITGDMYRLGQLSKKEAACLLSFCNNIGPVFFTGFVLSFLPKELPIGAYLFGMYGIPLCYGCLLRHTYYKNAFCDQLASCIQKPIGQRAFASGSLCTQKPPSFAAALDAAVSSGIQSITKLGGYMIFFHLLNLLPQLLLCRLPASFDCLRVFCSLLLEVTGGIVIADTAYPVLMLTMLQLGGISCFAQTYSMIADTDLSMPAYILHKGIQALLTCIYYSILFWLCI